MKLTSQWIQSVNSMLMSSAKQLAQIKLVLAGSILEFISQEILCQYCQGYTHQSESNSRILVCSFGYIPGQI